MNNATIVAKALAASTPRDAADLQRAVEAAVGGRYERPLGDTWGNMGLISGGGGSFDHKALENVTNMQDAVLELLAVAKHGSVGAAPYTTPVEAAEDLLSGLPADELNRLTCVEFRESDPPATKSKRLTILCRDRGCGITPGYIAESIFALGSDHKNTIPWQQGAFGVGGKTTYRNAQYVVLVTRRDPRLVGVGEPDVIAIAVLEWRRDGKKDTAFYLVDRPWTGRGDNAAVPFTVDATEFPGFEPGTHLALISYYVEGFYRARQGDEKTFDTVCNTRLFRPITPVRFTNATEAGRDRNDYLRGLGRRLADNNPADRPHGSEEVPVHLRGKTYRLPIEFWVFAPRGEAGERRSFVAQHHCVMFTSNGQVHHHWTPQDLRYKTAHLQKLYDRLLVVVDTDALPIEVRTSLFTADRTATVRNEEADKLERSVMGVLDGWDELREINGAIIREALTKSDSSVSTINVARQIGRAFKDLGFGLSTLVNGQNGQGGGGGVKKPPKPPEELYPDPTYFQGPEAVELLIDRTAGVMFSLNAEDGFIPDRATVTVTSDHPDLQADEIVVGTLHNGRLRVLIAVPDTAPQGAGWTLTARIEPWLRTTGGLGPALTWTSDLSVVATRTSSHAATGTGPNGTGNGGPAAGSGSGGTLGAGDLVPVIWQPPDPTNQWDAKTPGTLEELRACDVAAALPEYAEALGPLGSAEVLTLQLNSQYAPFKKYVQLRTTDTSDQGIKGAKNRYAVGVGVGMALLRNDLAKARKTESIPERAEACAYQAIARAVLANMPQYDELARETGIEKGLDDGVS
jgi:hypothetical protein